MCHYRHRAHDNPLILVGLQDITAHIDFTAIAESAEQNHLEIAGYTNQANFLLDCGLTPLLSEYNQNSKQYIDLTQGVKKLILPTEMGEFFKVMALTIGLHIDLIGFSKDDRYKL
jgi:SAM-dependent MidA family methyltransferase